MPKTRIRYADAMTMSEAAKRAGVHVRTLYNWVRAGHPWAQPDTLRGKRPGFTSGRIAEIKTHTTR